MIRTLQADQEVLTGKLVMLTDGLQQSFSHLWRQRTHARQVPVSRVIALLLADESQGQWKADVVEFDVNGCAMSRTLMPGNLWNVLLKAAIGVQV
jgi:hypothetical protein